MKTQKQLKQRKFLVALPILIIPFLTMIFWALGGGKGSAAQTTGGIQQNGLNMQLPNANLKDEKGLSKMSFYQQADKDSLKLKEAEKNDPYSVPVAAVSSVSPVYDSVTRFHEGLGNNHLNMPVDPNEEKINQRLALLQEQLSKPVAQSGGGISYQVKPDNDNDIARLQLMMAKLNQQSQADPQMQQLSNMLDKIQDIQHPDREQQKVKEASEKNRKKAYPVSINNEGDVVQTFGPSGNEQQLTNTVSVKVKRNGFYELNDKETKNSAGNAIEASIANTVTVSNGSTVKMELLSDIYVNGILISAGTNVFGNASINGDRLMLQINSLRYNNSIMHVALTVYDMDGLTGINIPGAMTRDVAKSSSDGAIQSLDLYPGYNSSLGAQAATAGVQAAKTLFSKKVKQVKVTLKAGYKLLLKDANDEE